MNRHFDHKFLLAATLCLLLIAPSTVAQQGGRPQLNEDYTFNAPSVVPRPLHYRPEGDAAVLVTGTARFNRALYGAHSGFRVECSDSPEFGLYLPGMGGNLLLTLPEGACETRYEAGRMSYRQGDVRLDVEVIREGPDAALWQLCNEGREAKTIAVRFGGVSGQKFYRNGDLGVDDPTAFDLKEAYCVTNRYQIEGEHILVTYHFKAEERVVSLRLPLDRVVLHEQGYLEGEMTLRPHETRLLVYRPYRADAMTHNEALQVMAQAVAQRERLAATLQIDTPDPWINPIASALAVAADGLWSGRTWLHGAIGWRTEHLGWRGAYVGSTLGWHERARTHFMTYAENMVRDVEPTLDHPRQDSALNLARAEKRWGTPMYSNGYICRRPHRREMSHYDMNLVYIDALLRHIRATGDEAFMRRIFPTIERHLAWEKRNFDPDGDHLYDAYCCIWASDALYYNAGAVTHSSAYNYFANREAARIAERIGLDPTPFRTEAEAIRQAMRKQLWDAQGEHWAEFRDAMGHRRLHTSAALWTIYHAIDSEVGTPLEACASARYVRRELPHLALRSTDFDEVYHLPSTTDWQPYLWSINNVAIAEVMHMALAYWQAGMNDEAFHLMKGMAMDNMYLGTSPLNFGQLSYLDAARGECYRDFADPIGVWARALVEGLYGICPDLVARRVVLRPGFPSAWDRASIRHRDIDYSFERQGNHCYYTIRHRYPEGTTLCLAVDPRGLERVTCYDQAREIETITFSADQSQQRGAAERAIIELRDAATYRVELCYRSLPEPVREAVVVESDHTPPPTTYCRRGLRMQPLDLTSAYNGSVNEIYRNEYLAPRPAVTTLQIPKQGYGDWCHPQAMVEIDDSGLRDTLRRYAVDERLGRIERGSIPWLLPHTGANVVFTSLWENYPDQVTIPLKARGSRLLLLMVGSTNHMQSHIANGVVEVQYTDGTTSQTELINPDNWCSIEQLGIDNGGAFRTPALERLSLDGIHFGPTIGRTLGLEGVNQPIPYGAAVVVEIPLSADKELCALRVETLSNDVVVGLMGATLVL